MYFNVLLLNLSDTMGNRGAFITLNGSDMKPYFTSYDAMVCILFINHVFYFLYLYFFFGFIIFYICYTHYFCLVIASSKRKADGLCQFFTKVYVLVEHLLDIIEK